MDKDGNADKKRVLKAKHRYALLAKVRHANTCWCCYAVHAWAVHVIANHIMSPVWIQGCSLAI